jgi:hydrogenase maturation protease
LDFFLGYERAILLDAIQTGRQPAGAIIELGVADLSPIAAPSPHFTGLPEMISIARQLQLDFPGDFRIFAVEVADPHTLGGGMSPAVREAIPRLCERVRAALKD